MMQRIQKIIAQAGITSRRKAEELIERGLVSVNGRIAQIGESADLDKDHIEVEGERITKQQFVYVVMNKPLNVVTTLSDEQGRPTVADMVVLDERVFPVGRLDRNATGLVFLTNDGELANRMMHPRYETLKTYRVTLSSPVDPFLIKRLKKGVMVEDRLVKIHEPAQVGTHSIEVSIHEGRKHIIKKLFVKLGTHVDSLTRTKLGPLELGKMKPGEWRALNPKEVLRLKQALKMP